MVLYTYYNAGSSGTWAIDSITYNGVAMTQGASQNAQAWYSKSSVWYLANPTAGTANIVITYNASVDYGKGWYVGAFEGVDQVSPVGGTNGIYDAAASTSESISVTTIINNSLLIGGFGSDSKTISAGSGTAITASSGTNYGMMYGTSYVSPAGSSSLNVTLDSSGGELGLVAIAAKPADTSFYVKTGTYTGNGGTSGTRAITGIGFQPKAVFVWSADTVEKMSPAFSFQSAITGLGSNLAYLGENSWSTNTVADRFQSFDSDGFTIAKGSGSTAGLKTLNKDTVVFNYLALGGDDIVSGTYAGNATDNRSITGVGFQPIWVLTMGGGNHSMMKFNSSGASTDTSSYTYNAANVANGIQALQADGFQVGTLAGVNASATNYYFIAVKAGQNVYQNEYSGNATDNRNITGVGFTPDLVFIKSEAARNFALRSSDHSGDLSKYYRSSGFAANYIQSFNSDGFQVGNAADINTSADVLCYIAFQTGSGSSPNTTNFFLMM